MLVTVEEFKASRYYKSDWPDTEVEKALLYAESRFYILTNREKFGYWFEPRELTLVLDGTGGRLLRSPYPVLRIYEARVLTKEGEEDVTDLIRHRGHFVYFPSTWEEEFANVTIRADFGDPAYADRPVPEDVKEAIKRLANMKLRRHFRVAGEELAERRPPTEEPPPPTITGDREVDQIIRSYYVSPPLFFLDLRGPLD